MMNRRHYSNVSKEKMENIKLHVGKNRLKFHAPFFPTEDDIELNIIQRLQFFDKQLALIHNAENDGADSQPDTLRPLIEKLFHPLSIYVAKEKCSENHNFLRAGLCLSHQSQIEADILKYYLPRFCHVIEIEDSEIEFFSLLESMASKIQNREINFRQNKIFTAPDSAGYSWEYADHDSIIPQLTLLYGFLRRTSAISALFSAVVAIVFLNCLHPFMDGNGRISRIIFNMILAQRGLVNSCYIPCKEIFLESQFGFVIRIRETFLTGNWENVLTYFCDAVDLCVHLSKPIDQNRTR